MNDWNALFDEVKTKGRFGSDAQLADSLGLTRAQISAWRTGKSDLGTLTKLKLLDVLGQADMRAAVLSLLPEKSRDAQIAQHLLLAERVAQAASLAEQGEDACVESGAQPPSAANNRLLAVLPAVDRARLAPHLVPVSLPLGRVVYEAGDRLSHLYLPTTAVLSMLRVLEDGALAEIAMIGKEGLLGIAMFMGGDTVPSRAVVQNAGHAYRLDSEVVREEFARGGAVQRLFLSYIHTLLTQIAQTAVCNRHHSVAQQLCRWLLLILDQIDSNEVHVTQESIANLLGIRRASIAEVIRDLQRTAVIRYRRGVIEVLDRESLGRHACECYGIVRRDCDRLFSRFLMG